MRGGLSANDENATGAVPGPSPAAQERGDLSPQAGRGEKIAKCDGPAQKPNRAGGPCVGRTWRPAAPC